MSAQADAPPRDANLPRLVARLQQQRDRAKLGRRPDSPNGDGTPRPRGIPAVEAKRRQLAVARLLDAIAEPDFLRGS